MSRARPAAALGGQPTAGHLNSGLHRLVERQAERTPHSTAVVDANHALSYAELNARADRVARLLQDHGVGPDTPVGIMLDRSADLVAALLGVLKAGGAYLPVETDTPPARVAQILGGSGATACLAPPELAPIVAGAGVRPLTPTDLPDGAPVPRSVDPDQLCAVYYTSGSTGRPKGVACTHRGWLNRMRWMQRHHPLHPGDTVLHKTTLTFDDAAVEIFWPLTVGGRVAILPPGLHRDPRAIIEAAIRYAAVHVQFVPSMLDLFLDTVTDADTARLSALRSVLSSGEALRPDLVRRFFDRFGDRVVLDNTWGATEVSIDSTCHVCRPEDGTGSGAVSLGRPIDGNEVFLLDGRSEPVAAGTPGELHLGGVGLARGYLHDPGRTAAAFVPHPSRPGERLYRTGDIGRVRPDGAFEYLGRQDDQVKIRGVRIELGEVESALRGHPAVSDAAVIATEVQPGDRRLAAYAVIAPGATCTPADLRDHLRDVLPSYAVPGAIAVLDTLPRLPSGKLDRHALPAPDTETNRDAAFVAPRTPTEQALAEMWATVLGLARVGAEDNFFAIGGHSLLATRVVSRMRRTFGVDVPMSLLFERPTLAGTAARLEELILLDVTAMSESEAERLTTG